MLFILSRVRWMPIARGYSLASFAATFRVLTALSIFTGIFCSGAKAQVYEKVFSFTDARIDDLAHSANKGSEIYAGLVQGSDGNFYGTTGRNGASNSGTVFKMTSAGVLTTLVEFTGAGTNNRR